MTTTRTCDCAVPAFAHAVPLLGGATSALASANAWRAGGRRSWPRVATRARSRARGHAAVMALPVADATVAATQGLLTTLPSLVLGDDIYGEIASGGLLIIASGIVGGIIAGLLMSRNYEELNEQFQNRFDEMEMEELDV